MTPSKRVFPSMDRLCKIIPRRSFSKNMKKFINAVNNHIDVLNKYICNYNFNQDALTLRKIYQEYKKMADKYPSRYINSCFEYDEIIHRTLFCQIKKQAGYLGFDSLSCLEPSNISPPTHPGTMLARILEDMDPKKVADLAVLLSRKTLVGVDLVAEDLYDKYDPNHMKFKLFLHSHRIHCLSQDNNYNFKITRSDGAAFVLKLNNSFGLPRVKAAQLRQVGSLQNVFTPSYAERQTTFLGPDGQPITRTFAITDFCAGGDLMAHTKRHVDDSARISAALDLFTQMATILLQIKDNKCLHSDMKNSNWLVDHDDRLHIADDKALLPAKSGTWWRRKFNYKEIIAEFYALLSTPPMNPPEFISSSLLKNSISVGKVHSYMFGKNLYQYLTQCDLTYLDRKHNATCYSFRKPLFQTSEGVALRGIIEALVKPQPRDRMRMKDALKQLQSIRLSLLKKTIVADLKQFRRHQLIDGDRAVKDFIDEKMIDLNQLPQELERTLRLQKEIMRLLRGLDNGGIVNKIRLLQRNKTDGIRLRVDTLIKAMCDRPLAERIVSSTLSQELEQLLAHQKGVKKYQEELKTLGLLQWDRQFDKVMIDFLKAQRIYIHGLATDPTEELAKLQLIRVVLEDAWPVMQKKLNRLTLIADTYPLLQPFVNDIKTQCYVIPIEARALDSQPMRDVTTAIEILEQRAECYRLLFQIKRNKFNGWDSEREAFIKRKTIEITQTSVDSLPVLTETLQKMLADQADTIPVVKKVLVREGAFLPLSPKPSVNQEKTKEHVDELESRTVSAVEKSSLIDATDKLRIAAKKRSEQTQLNLDIERFIESINNAGRYEDDATEKKNLIRLVDRTTQLLSKTMTSEDYLKEAADWNKAHPSKANKVIAGIMAVIAASLIAAAIVCVPLLAVPIFAASSVVAAAAGFFGFRKNELTRRMFAIASYLPTNPTNFSV